jgi:hypothetical protein
MYNLFAKRFIIILFTINANCANAFVENSKHGIH